MNNAIINQLEKALKCKDDKELRIRIEVLLDMLKEESPRPTYIPVPQTLPTQPTVTYEAEPPKAGGEIPKAYRVPKQMKEPRINGTGPIVSNGEQVQYVRPKGT